MNNYYTDFNEIQFVIATNKKGGIPVSYQVLENYNGMVFYIGIIYDAVKSTFDLNLEWSSWGLDFFGDTLQEGYVYRFHQLESLLNYIKLKYNIEINDIPLKLSVNQNDFPNVINNADKKQEFETDWKRFQSDFKTHLFLDRSLSLLQTTHPI